MKRIIVILIGAALLISAVITGSYGLSEINEDIYRQAAELENSANFGFENFRLTDYPVAFYDGDKDYVLTYENGEVSVNKRKPVLDVMAATAYPVEEHFEVLVPTVERMESLVGIIGMGKADYKAEEHISTLWHEAFHCYQLSNYRDNIENISDIAVSESIISEYADSNNAAVELFTKQSELLQRAVNTDDIDKLREIIVEYKQLGEEREALLFKEVIALEKYYTTVEGSACYIEARVYKLLKPDDFAANYIDAISIYSGGSGKYYKTGMSICMILDKIDPEWKENYDFSLSPTELLYRELEL